MNYIEGYHKADKLCCFVLSCMFVYVWKSGCRGYGEKDGSWNVIQDS